MSGDAWLVVSFGFSAVAFALLGLAGVPVPGESPSGLEGAQSACDGCGSGATGCGRRA
jgi:hypothetical protein